MTGDSRPLASRSIGLVLSCVGLIGLVVSGGMLFDFWYARSVWLGSEERQRIERQVEHDLSDRAEPALDASPVPRFGVQVRRSESFAPRPVHVPPAVVGRDPNRPQRRVASDRGTLEVVETHVRLLDLPRPGARAVLAVTLRNRSEVPSPPVAVGVSADWFEHYTIIGAIPPVLDDRDGGDGYRYFEFPGATPGADVTLELHVSTVGEAAGAPMVRLSPQAGEPLGEVRPEIVAEGIPLGPVRALSVPRLDIRTGVVDTAWEPPPFVAGQIGTSADLGEGNSVLIGHRGGLAGDVFKRLIGARLGDEVVAASHGVERRYIVSEIRVLPNDIATPLGPTETPRLTLMTCVGAWNPLTGDYSHRLWVIAEPPDLARETLTGTVARAGQVATASADPLEAARARTDAALARAALAVMDARPRSRP